jgi:hypothetical protein
MTMREDFEKHFSQHWKNMYVRTKDGRYEFEEMNKRWADWQAAAGRDAEVAALEESIESLVTALANHIYDTDELNSGACWLISDHEKARKAARVWAETYK